MPVKPVPQEFIDACAALQAKGWTRTKIAAELGLTRSQVSGILYRHVNGRQPMPAHIAARNPNRRGGTPMRKKTPPAVTVRPPSLPVPREELPPALDESGNPFTIETVGTIHCRWPMGEPSESMPVCGHRPEPGKPYCAHHLRRAWGRAA